MTARYLIFCIALQLLLVLPPLADCQRVIDEDNDFIPLLQDFVNNLGMEELLIQFANGSYNWLSVPPNGINEQCIEDSHLYLTNLFINISTWALQMQESSGIIPSGLFGSGNYNADGLFDECLRIRAPNFVGQYCTIFIKPSVVEPNEIIDTADYSSQQEVTVDPIASMLQPFTASISSLFGSRRVIHPKTSKADSTSHFYPRISLCLPSSCSSSDIGQTVANIIGSVVLPGNLSIVTVTDDNYCFVHDSPSPSVDGPVIAVIVTLSILGVLVLLATVHESWRMLNNKRFDAKSDGWLLNSLHCFSVLENGRKILSMRVSSSSDNLACIDGIRFISTLWAVSAHTWLAPIVFNHVLNPKGIHLDARSWWIQTFDNSSVSVDTFFLVSGLLVSYTLLKELDRNKGRFNVFLFYLHRYLRLTMVYAIILGFCATLIVYVGTGPNWYDVITSSQGCRSSWWKKLLYINNFVSSSTDDARCMQPTWYMAVDMQLFLVSPIFIYAIWHWKKYGLALLAGAILASVASAFAVFAIMDIRQPTLMLSKSIDVSIVHFLDYYYMKVWNRASPYLLGIWLGWYLHITKITPMSNRLSKIFVATCWITSISIGLVVVYGLTSYFDESSTLKVPTVVSLVYGPLNRTAWAVAVAWVIFACNRGYGGFVNRFLSWKGFLPLSRLTYCAYLIHFDYLTVYYAMGRKLIYYTFFTFLTTYFGIVFGVFGLAFFVSVTVETSLFNLKKLLFDKPSSSSGKTAANCMPNKECDVNVISVESSVL